MQMKKKHTNLWTKCQKVAESMSYNWLYLLISKKKLVVFPTNTALTSSSGPLGWWQQPEFLQQWLMENHSTQYVSWRKMTVHSEKSKNMISDWRGKNQASVRLRKSRFSSHLSLIITQVLTSYWKVLNGLPLIKVRTDFSWGRVEKDGFRDLDPHTLSCLNAVVSVNEGN